MKNIETIAQVYRGSNDKQNKLSFTVLIEQSREQKEITVLLSTLAIKKWIKKPQNIVIKPAPCIMMS